VVASGAAGWHRRSAADTASAVLCPTGLPTFLPPSPPLPSPEPLFHRWTARCPSTATSTIRILLLSISCYCNTTSPLSPSACQVDGPLSVYCYLNTMDLLLARYAAKFEKRMGRAFCLESDAGERAAINGFSARVSVAQPTLGNSLVARACGRFGQGCCYVTPGLLSSVTHFGPPCLPPRLTADHALFHAPYNKLVQKAFARLLYHDMCK